MFTGPGEARGSPAPAVTAGGTLPGQPPPSAAVVLFAALHILRAGYGGLSLEGVRHTCSERGIRGKTRRTLWAFLVQGKAQGSWDKGLQGSKELLLGLPQRATER